MTKTILATGGAGYIGSHVVTELVNDGYHVVILDNFENSDPAVIDRLQQITGQEIEFVQADVADKGAVLRTLKFYDVDAVIHLAGKKAVGESVADPLLYFRKNLNGAIALLEAMSESGTDRLVFSSSATVYGTPETLPIDESFPTGVTNPYGRTKLMIEQMIDDVVAAHQRFACMSLRYFNPVGAHESGMIGESPRDVPNNLFPYVAETAAKLRPEVMVFGNDYDTADGTGLRDYIHVVDLARGHVAAVNHLLNGIGDEQRHRRVNLGTGQGHTVLEVIRAFSQACGRDVPYRLVDRRPGDVASSVANASLAETLLEWKAEHGLGKMCLDHWRFQQMELKRSGMTLRSPVATSARAISANNTG